jgi:flavin reductase (DIM6/NTAB) family NADH-FMN oxidoreductase RutF
MATATDTPSPHSVSLRAALGRFATGVTVVTARASQGKLVGITANSFSSVSLDPPLVLWCLSRRSPSLEPLRSAEGFVVNVLSRDQESLVGRFSQPSTDKFAGVAWRSSRAGAPILDGAIAHFECAHHIEYDGGDHVIFVGRVESFAVRNGEPLVYALGRLGTTSHPARPADAR